MRRRKTNVLHRRSLVCGRAERRMKRRLPGIVRLRPRRGQILRYGFHNSLETQLPKPMAPTRSSDHNVHLGASGRTGRRVSSHSIWTRYYLVYCGTVRK